MTLSIQRSERRDRRLCRFGVMLVVCSLVINMVAVPKAQAVVTETAALGAAATVCVVDYSTAALLVSGMKTGAVTSSVIGMMDSYAVATGVAASGTALASSIATGILVAGGTLLVGAAAAALIGGFIDWLREEKGLVADGSPVIGIDDSSYWSGDIKLFHFDGSDSPTSIGTVFSVGDVVGFNGKTYTAKVEKFGSTDKFRIYCGDSCIVDMNKSSYSGNWGFGYSQRLGSGVVCFSYNDGVRWRLTGGQAWGAGDFVESKIELHPNQQFVSIPSEIPEGQVLSIDTGLSTLPQGDPQGVADAIMQSAIDGALAPTVSVEADPSVQPDPEPEPDPDPELPTDAPELPSNLGDLGNALTTRFPFSIPWDIAKAVKLLAAPAKPPYWEIDFMEPIRYRFSDLGDTTITIDLGKPEYEIIGITTRLTSTIGFCLALAAATKRFIWTA